MVVKEFTLPDLGEGVAEGELVQWLVEPGDPVTEDQSVAEVETDKALVEVPSPYDGTVEELLADEGEIVPVGNVLITFDVEGEPEEAADEPAGEEAEGATDADAEPTDADAEPSATDAAPAETGGDEAEVPEGRVFAPPSARRLARELDVDIAAVDGTGPGGRVTEQDVRQHAEAAGAADTTDEAPAGSSAVAEAAGAGEDGTSAESPATTESAPAETPDRDRTLAVPATRQVADELDVDIDAVPTDETRDDEAFVTEAHVRQYAEAQREAREAEVATGAAGGPTEGGEVETTAAGDVETVPYRGVRRTIGEQMETSKFTAPHVSHHDTAVVDELVDVRADLKERAEAKGVQLTYMPFVMKAIAAALKEYPHLNATLDEEDGEIALKKYYNIGIAVATDAGLMVPVVENVDGKSLVDLAAEVNDLATRARNRELTPEEMQGGTFTITNFGAIGGEYATPIINSPETAILGLGAIEKRPVVREVEDDGFLDDEGPTEQVVPAHTLPLSLSIDHRVIDGAVAAEFANAVMEYLENPRLLLLE